MANPVAGGEISAAVPDAPPSIVVAAREAFAGRRRGVRALLPFAGPAFVASIAYMDPGNFATNVQAGARYGYDLLWVVVVANVVAMLFQALSARMGIVTGRNLAELCAQAFSRPVVIAMWIVSEIAAMATDLAEFLGGAIGFALLFHFPLPLGMLVTGVLTYALLLLQRHGIRRLEIAIGTLVGVISLAYLIELFIAPPDWAGVVRHSVLPQLDDAQAVTLAVGIIGATVMPHALYLHSGLTQDRIVPRNEDERRRLVVNSNREVVVALGLAGLVNMAMVAMAARVFHPAHANVASIETAYHTLVPLLGGAAASVYLVSLFASGLSSSAVGTLAGQVVMQGFVNVTIPIWLRRLVTMVPAFVVVALGVNATQALVVSQVILSLVLPVPMIALIVLGARRKVMGAWTTRPAQTALAGVACVLVLGLNLMLVAGTLGLPLPLGK